MNPYGIPRVYRTGGPTLYKPNKPYLSARQRMMLAKGASMSGDSPTSNDWTPYVVGGVVAIGLIGLGFMLASSKSNKRLTF